MNSILCPARQKKKDFQSLKLLQLPLEVNYIKKETFIFNYTFSDSYILHVYK